MSYIRILSMFSLFAFLTGCWPQEDRHPEMPFIANASNNHIKVDSLDAYGIDRFIFSSDKTKLYVLLSEPSTGGSYDFYLIEYDQNGKRLRQLSLGNMGMTSTSLTLLDSNTLMWDYANVFYIINLPAFKVIDEVFAYYSYIYPEADAGNKLAKTQTQDWLEDQRKKIGLKYNVQKTDSTTFDVLEGDKNNKDAYWTAMTSVRKQTDSMEYALTVKYYQAYAAKEIKAGKPFLKYTKLGSDTEYLFTQLSTGKNVAFLMDESINPTGVNVAQVNLNPGIGKDDNISKRDSRFLEAADRKVTDKSCSIEITEKITTKYNQYKLMGPDEIMLYYKVKLGKEATEFKLTFAIDISNDFYLQSANGSAFVLARGQIYRFTL